MFLAFPTLLRYPEQNGLAVLQDVALVEQEAQPIQTGLGDRSHVELVFREWVSPALCRNSEAFCDNEINDLLDWCALGDVSDYWTSCPTEAFRHGKRLPARLLPKWLKNIRSIQKDRVFLCWNVTAKIDRST